MEEACVRNRGLSSPQNRALDPCGFYFALLFRFVDPENGLIRIFSQLQSFRVVFGEDVVESPVCNLSRPPKIMDAANSNGRRSSVSLPRSSIDGDWRVRGDGSDAYKSSLLYAASNVPGRQRVSFADERDRNRDRLTRSTSIQSNSGKNSDDEGATQSGSEGGKSGGSEHAAMNAKRMSMDPAPYDFNDPMFSTDEFRVWEMKIRNCPKSRPHDWTCCPFAHPGEKAKRRDPRLFNYCGTACADYRKSGACARGDSCMYAHGVFECWLHPSRYRTQLCTDGEACSRRVCFFAHRECELRKPVGGQMAAIPQPGVNALEGLGITGITGNGMNGMNGMAHAEMAAEARRRASMGAIPMGAKAPYVPQQRASESSSLSLSAAIQMLDPVSKHRLLEALQNDLHENASQSSFFGSHDPAHANAKPAHMSDSQTLLEAIQQLQLGTRASRHSLDDITPILSGQSGVGGVGSRHASGLPQYNQTHQYLNSITSSRKSVDIGAISRLASSTDGFTNFHSKQMRASHLGGSSQDGLAAGRSSIDGVSRNVPSQNIVNLGGLYESSVAAMNASHAPTMMRALGDAEATLGRRSSTDPFGQSVHHPNSTPNSHRLSFADDPRMNLGKIVENPNSEVSDGSRSGGSSSSATFYRSSSEGSNVGSNVACHEKSTNGTTANPVASKNFQREFSVDNLLAELPRSASQVDLVSHQ